MQSRSLFAIAALATLASCGTTKSKAEELEHVAKDWCLTIRASQVIPVYPLTEDLQPGDVFLVQTRIEDQVAEYTSKGFLPLENLVTRVAPECYPTFYGTRYGLPANATPPSEWQSAASSPVVKVHRWDEAPRAALPSYSFHVSRQEGFNLAIPVQAVPVGLSFLNSAEATGTVQISDAFTYGAEMASLQAQVAEWAAKHRAFLAQFEPRVSASDGREDSHYLRVVSRVYLTGRVDVSLLNSAARGGNVDAGAPKPVTLSDIATQSNAANLASINASLAESLPQVPGGSLKVTAASDRAVSMSETFARPLVIGYLAFDLRILRGGALGPPVATQARIERGATMEASQYGLDANSQRIGAWLDRDAANVATLRAWLATEAPDVRGITNVVEGAEHRELRARIVEELEIP